MLCNLEEGDPNEVPKTLSMDSLENWFPKKAPAKSFSAGKFSLLVLKFIVACDLVSCPYKLFLILSDFERQPLSTVNAEEFREMIMYLRPYIKPADFPDRHNLAELAMAQLELLRDATRKKLAVSLCSLSRLGQQFTSDCELEL